MGILGSALGRGLAGAGAAVESLANKYIDQELAQQRAQALADIQLQSQKDLDSYTNSPGRREAMRGEAGKDYDAQAAGALRAKINEAQSTDLTEAEIARTNRTAEGTADTAAKVAGKITRARTDNTGHDLKPGEKYFVGSTQVAENERQTAGELNFEAMMQGLKGNLGKGAASAADKMSDGAKIQLKAAEDRDKALQATIDKGVTEGTLSPTPQSADGKPNPGYENYRYLMGQRQALAVQKLKILASEGVMNGAEDGARLLEMGTNSADLTRNIEQAKQIGGRYAQDFIATVKPALDKMSTPEYKKASIDSAVAANGDDKKGYTTDIGGVKGEVKPIMQSAAERKSAPPAEETPPDSPSGKFKARQAALAEEGAKRKKDGQAKAQAEFAKTDLNNPLAAQDLQDSPLFKWLTAEQKAAVRKAVMGR